MIDLMFAIRSQARKPLFSASIVAILALGIGVNTAVFTIVDAVLLQPLSWLASLLYETGSTDPVACAGAALPLLAVGVAASARPAWKAATKDPIRALRAD